MTPFGEENIVIRALASGDCPCLLEMAASTGMFTDAEVAVISGRLSQHFAGSDESIWLVSDDSALNGVAYCVPEPMTNGTWNLLMLFVATGDKGKGVGSMLVKRSEQAVISRSGRLLMVETAGTDDFAQARRFYAKCGFIEVAAVPEFYDTGVDKIILSKRLSI